MKKIYNYKQKIGGKGELIAKEYLLQRRYQFIASNFHTRFGEIDLIFHTEQDIIFVEVKTRVFLQLGYPEEAISKKKLQHIQKAAEIFLVKHPQYDRFSPRIDVVTIQLPKGKAPMICHYDAVSQ